MKSYVIVTPIGKTVGSMEEEMNVAFSNFKQLKEANYPIYEMENQVASIMAIRNLYKMYHGILSFKLLYGEVTNPECAIKEDLGIK